MSAETGRCIDCARQPALVDEELCSACIDTAAALGFTAAQRVEMLALSAASMVSVIISPPHLRQRTYTPGVA